MIAINSLNKEKNIRKGCSKVFCCGPGSWNIQVNTFRKLEYTKYTKEVAFADDILIMIKSETVGEAETIANVEIDKISTLAKDNEINLKKKNPK